MLGAPLNDRETEVIDVDQSVTEGTSLGIDIGWDYGCAEGPEEGWLDGCELG